MCVAQEIFTAETQSEDAECRRDFLRVSLRETLRLGGKNLLLIISNTRLFHYLKKYRQAREV
jgi:hypothetical protein